MVELEAVPLDPQLQARARRRECPLLLLPVERIEDGCLCLSSRLVNLRDDEFEPAPPAVDPSVRCDVAIAFARSPSPAWRARTAAA